MDNKINPITARFASKETEAAYQAFIFEGDWRNNIYVVGIGLVIYLLYFILDIGTIQNWQGAAAIRISAVGVCAALLVTACVYDNKTIREFVPLIDFVIVGAILNVIIFLYTDLKDAYYVGLVQTCVFVSFLLRMSFVKTLAAMSSYVIGFSALSSIKYGYDAANVQIVVLLTMSIVCSIGSYLLQKLRRLDFQKTLIIEVQNKRLKVLLEDVQRDNERKLAAMNLLVHFVKTPLHQINGFSDIVMNSLNKEDSGVSLNEGVEGARYIKTATANLSKSVNSLLTYHRLDESERRRQYDKVDIDAAFGDFGEMISGDVSVKIEGRARALLTVPAAIKTAVECFAGFYNESLNGATRIELTLERHGDVARIVLRDNGRTMTRDEFHDKTMPLTKIDSYLTSAGSQMPMLLRTVARAIDLCGGAFGHAPRGAGNEFVITLPDRAVEAAAAEAAA